MAEYVSTVSVPPIIYVAVFIGAVLFTVALLIWSVDATHRPTDYRVAPHVQHNNLGEARTLYKIQVFGLINWRDHTAFEFGLDFIPMFETPEEAEAEIHRLRSRFR